MLIDVRDAIPVPFACYLFVSFLNTNIDYISFISSMFLFCLIYLKVGYRSLTVPTKVESGRFDLNTRLILTFFIYSILVKLRFIIR